MPSKALSFCRASLPLFVLCGTIPFLMHATFRITMLKLDEKMTIFTSHCSPEDFSWGAEVNGTSVWVDGASLAQKLQIFNFNKQDLVRDQVQLYEGVEI